MGKIAMFVDVDNLGLSAKQFKEITDYVSSAGKVVYGKIYGVIDRKNKEIIDCIVNRGYDMAPPMRVKKRGSKVFDNRILVDVMEIVVANEKIDTVAIVCAPSDLVPLFSKLREYGVSIMAMDNLDKESMFFVDDVILGEEDESGMNEAIEDMAVAFAEKRASKDSAEEKAENADEETSDEEDYEEDEEDYEDEKDSILGVLKGLEIEEDEEDKDEE